LSVFISKFLFSLLIHTYPPIITVKQPITIEPPWAQVSPILAAGFPPIITVEEPFAIVSGGPTHTQESPTTAAGNPPINTVGSPGPITGPPACGMGEGTAGVCIGQMCISVNLAALGIIFWC
jgi:hypothetical protein